MLIPLWHNFVLHSIAKECAIFNVFGTNSKLFIGAVTKLRQQKAPPTTVLAAGGDCVIGIRGWRLHRI